MEQQKIMALMDKYWLAETSVEEEAVLGAYFRQPDIAPELEPFRYLFAYYEEESQLVPSAALEEKIMKIIEQPPRRLGWWYGAAAAVVLGIGLYLAYPLLRPHGEEVVKVPVGKEIVVAGREHVTDTYDDPQEALVAVQKALMTVSVKIDRGKHMTQQRIGRLNDRWKMAVRD
jgi:hypothetical protein